MLKVVAIITLAGLANTAPTEQNVNFNPINEFALKLLDNTYAYQENFGRNNVAISPLSVWSIFGLLAEGSTGDTFQELMNTLKLPTDLKVTQALHLAIKSLLETYNNDVILKGQKAMFTECASDIHPDFCEAALIYDTEIYSVDPSNTTQLAHDINYYICLETDGKIFKVVEPENLENLRLILIDALYFKASWTHSFDPTQTKEETFYNSLGKSIGAVNMMYHKAPHVVGESNEIGAQILEMTYGKDERFSMLILLPYDGMPLKKLLNNLATQSLNWMTEFKIGGSLPSIDCYVPRFKISAKTDMIPPLQYTGIYSIFDVNKAQLPGIANNSLYVSKTIQNVEIEVNEEGTVAAASTVVGLEDRILGQRFEANRGFVFLITERRSNVILFAGVYNDPSVV